MYYCSVVLKYLLSPILFPVTFVREDEKSQVIQDKEKKHFFFLQSYSSMFKRNWCEMS